MVRALLMSIIKGYRYCISPLLPSLCRFTPSCSQYSLEAIGRYGALKGLFLSLRRISKCHPFHPGGHDPVK
jgi:hypothetical protein